ncbi:hypothetical protein K1W54_03195 [Micromonospora sp. CPCC 205371]|nr:hypothetical protein [Micromonospora sp. CPCC 205371]
MNRHPPRSLRSIALFLAAAIAEIGGAWLVWQGVREHRGLLWIGAGSLVWGIVVDKFRPDRYDLAGAVLCLAGVAVIRYAHAAKRRGQRPGSYPATGILAGVAGVRR